MTTYTWPVTGGVGSGVKPRYFLVYDLAGNRLTTATPTFIDYRDTTGNARTPPANPFHVGFGLYCFIPSDADESVGTVALVDAGINTLPRRFCFAIHKANNTNQFWAFHVEDPAGVLWTGAPPTVGAYRNSAGAGVTPVPAVVPVSGAYLYSVTSSLDDDSNGIGIWVSYPAGASTTGYSGYTLGVTGGGGVNDFNIIGTTPSSYYLDLTFNDVVGPLTLQAASTDYWRITSGSVTPIFVTSVETVSPLVIRVHHTKPKNGDFYQLHMPLNGLKSIGDNSYNGAEIISFTAVAAAPYALAAQFLDVRTVRVIFSEPVQSLEATNPENYSITLPNLEVYGITQEAPDRYLIATGLQTVGTTYTVTVVNVKDFSQNTV